MDVLQNIVESYNNSRYSATKMAPSAVTLENAAVARENLIHRYAYRKHRSPKVSATCDASVVRKTFSRKGMSPGILWKFFKIGRISETRQPVVYYLKDLSGEDIEGFFYEQ